MNCRLERKSLIGVVEAFRVETLKSFGGFVGCGALTGLTYGVAKSPIFAVSANTTSVEDSLEFGAILFLFLTAEFAYQTYKNYKTYKKDRDRLDELTRQIQIEKKRKYEFSTIDMINYDFDYIKELDDAKPIFLANDSNDTSGGRIEELGGRQKTLNL